MSYDFKYVESTNYTVPSFKKVMAALKDHFKEWVRREIIDFDPYDEEMEFFDLPKELKTDK